MAPPTTIAETIPTNTDAILNINMSNVSKLTPDTYLTWKLQVHALLDGYELVDHLDESADVPPTTVTVGSVTSPNPDFTKWRRQDKLIYSALIGSISTPLQQLVARTTTAAQIWTKLASTYANPSCGHIRILRDQLKVIHKGTSTIDEYIQSVTARLDKLALLGKPMEHEDQIELILDGLPEDYRPVIDQIGGKDKTPQITEVHERLLNHEAKLLSKQAAPTSLFQVTANAAQHRPSNNNNRNNYSGKRFNNNNNNNSSWQPSQSQNSNDNRVSKPYLGKCQLCHTQGHNARRCPQFQSLQASPSTTPASPFRPWQPRANLAMNSPYSASPWLLDSGATHHLTADLNNMALHQPYNGGDDVVIADGSSMAITHTGSKLLPNQTRTLLLDKILCVPDLHKNLISVYRLCNTNGVSVEFFPASFQVKDLSTGVPLLQGKTKNELYEWPVTSSQAVALMSASGPKATLKSWYSRLGHPSLSILQSVISKHSLSVSSSQQTLLPCSHCSINKSHKLPFSQTTIVSTRPLEYIFTDVWTSPIHSKENHKYYLVLIDHFSRYTWIYPLIRKSDVRDIFPLFKALVENRFQYRIGTLFSDNGGEFVALRSFLATNGITHLTSPPHTPEHNGLAERKHRHIVETGLTLMSTSLLPTSYWMYAFSTAVYLINRMPTQVLSMSSPFEKLFGTPPNYEKLRIFGCLCFPWLRPYTSNKLQPRSQQCVFVGYSTSQSAYLCLHVPTGRLYVSRHVQFDESSFPFHVAKDPVIRDVPSTSDSPLVSVLATTPSPATTNSTASPLVSPSSSPTSPATTQNSLLRNTNGGDDISPSSNMGPSEKGPPTSVHQQNKSQAQQHSVHVNNTLSSSSSFHETEKTNSPAGHSPEPSTGTPHSDLHLSPSSSPTTQVLPSNSSTPSSSSQSEPTASNQNESRPTTQLNPNLTSNEPTAQRQNELQPTTQSRRKTNQPSHQAVPLQPQNQIIEPPQNIHKMQTRAKNNIFKPNQKFSLTVAGNKSQFKEPTTIHQALKDKEWSRACSAEFDALAINRTWDLVPPAATQNVVGCKWVFTTKFLPTGVLERYKARLVAKGFHQQYGKDYAETFSPVIKSTTIRLVLEVAVTKSWPIKQLDVNYAFLQGELTEEVYMSQPPGFVDKDKPSFVCRLRKPIYGLKQAPRAWYMALKQYLLVTGFANSMADTSLFIHSSAGHIIYVLVYVDDIIVTGSNHKLVESVLASIANRFSIKDPSDLHYFLGIEVILMTISPRMAT